MIRLPISRRASRSSFSHPHKSEGAGLCHRHQGTPGRSVECQVKRRKLPRKSLLDGSCCYFPNVPSRSNPRPCVSGLCLDGSPPAAAPGSDSDAVKRRPAQSLSSYRSNSSNPSARVPVRGRCGCASRAAVRWASFWPSCNACSAGGPATARAAAPCPFRVPTSVRGSSGRQPLVLFRAMPGSAPHAPGGPVAAGEQQTAPAGDDRVEQLQTTRPLLHARPNGGPSPAPG